MKSTRRLFQARWSLLAIMAAGAGPALADPFSIGVTAGFIRHSNLFLADGASSSSSDTVLTTGVQAGLDQPIGRQRVYANANLTNSRYQSNDTYNNTSYNLVGGLDWSTVERISGNVQVNTGRSLSQFGQDNTGAVIPKNLIRNDGLSLAARIGVATRLTAEATYAHQQVSNSADVYKPRDSKEDVVGANLKYAFSSALNAGVGFRHTKGSLPNYLPSTDAYTRNDIDFTTNYVPTSASTVNARISVSKSKYDQSTQRDISGLTGALSWIWKPTGKTQFTTQVSRDSGSQTNQIRNVSGAYLLDDNSQISTTLQTRVDQDLSAKVKAYAGVGVTKRNTVDVLSSNNTLLSTPGTDRTTFINAGLRWSPTRSIDVGCDIGRNQRSVDTGVSRSYSDNTVGCNASFTLR